jgi:phosphohistidine phosphatase SixA
MTRRRLPLALVLLIAVAPTAAAQDVVFVVRHAERADDGMQKGVKDPPLSAAGDARAQALARMLRGADVRHVFATEFKRTQQTAEPLAAAGHVAVTTIAAKDIDGLVQKLSGITGAALVVGHSDTVPDILHALGVKEDVRISDDEYDNLFIVVRGGGEARLIKLRF